MSLTGRPLTTRRPRARRLVSHESRDRGREFHPAATIRDGIDGGMTHDVTHDVTHEEAGCSSGERTGAGPHASGRRLFLSFDPSIRWISILDDKSMTRTRFRRSSSTVRFSFVPVLHQPCRLDRGSSSRGSDGSEAAPRRCPSAPGCSGSNSPFPRHPLAIPWRAMAGSGFSCGGIPRKRGQSGGPREPLLVP